MKYVIVFFLLIFSLNAFSKENEAVIKKNIDQLLDVHVEWNSLSPLLIERSFKNFIHYFDPQKSYFLEKEVQPYFSLTEHQIQKVLGGYQRTNFFEYRAFLDVLHKAIERAERLREEVGRFWIMMEPLEAVTQAPHYLTFAKDEEGIKERLLLDLQNKAVLEKTGTLAERELMVKFWKKKALYAESIVSQMSDEHFSLAVLKALARSLDAHTSFYSSSEAAQFRAQLEKEFEGFGIAFKEGVEGLFVSQIVKGGPADLEGSIKVGDKLTLLRNKPISSHEEVIAYLKEKKEALLGLERKGKFFQVSLKQRRILVQEERVKGEIIPFQNGLIGKITLPSFYESARGGAEKDIRQVIKKMRESGEIKGIILDLRENAGGFLKQAVKVAGIFIGPGLVVVSKYGSKDKNTGKELRFLHDENAELLYNGPLLVLTSKASASAAEILAGALQESRAALVVGDEHTYGKGTIQIQTLTDPEATAFFKVTVGRYYTGRGRSTQIEGVIPDIVLPSRFAGYKMGERFLDYPLSHDSIGHLLEGEKEKTNHWLSNKSNEELKIFISLLAKKSEQRRLQHKEYSHFLSLLDAKQQGGHDMPVIFKGKEDVQMQEAIAILKDVWSEPDLNRRHVDFQSTALPTELPDHTEYSLQ